MVNEQTAPVQARSNLANKQISVRITSDNICPWCRKGKAQLEEAMADERFAGIDFDVEVSFVLCAGTS